MRPFLEDGLPQRAITEWGMPLGRRGRELMLPFLAEVTGAKQMALWIYGHENMMVYPPAFIAAGINSDKMVFTQVSGPLQPMVPALISPLFKMIVLDSPKRFTDRDGFFLRNLAEAHDQKIVLIRNYFLSPKRGSSWARWRINVWNDSLRDGYHFLVVKGLVGKGRQSRETIANTGSAVDFKVNELSILGFD
jgi:hypothetical protein